MRILHKASTPLQTQFGQTLHRQQRRNGACRAAVQTSEPEAAAGTLTRRMFDRMAESSEQASGAGGSTTFEALQRADAMWYKLRHAKTGKAAGPAPVFVHTSSDPLPGGAPEFDVVVCGGTLGIFLAASLQLRGLKVAVVERGPLKGRAQEWNISRKEMYELVDVGVMTREEADACISVEFNPVRARFAGSEDVWTRDILNLGVSPVAVIAQARQRFEEAGGRVMEFTAVESATVHTDGVVLQLPQSVGRPAAAAAPAEEGGGSGSGAGAEVPGPAVTGKMLIDCMGHFSPIVRQVRWGNKPDGVCLVVGACNRGHAPESNTTGDVICTIDDLRLGASDSAGGAPSEGGGTSGSSGTAGVEADVRDCQLFWEAFPATDARDRTTYMFTYLDADEGRPSLEAMMELYWHAMPAYQDVNLESLTPLRILFGFFPTYRSSPLAPAFDRILQIGDASGIQSPLSFGGFGAMTRHLARLTDSITEAVQVDALDRDSLCCINAYNPGLSGAWMLQRAMSVRPGHAPAPNFINRLLGQNFAAMERMGDPVLKPFLQDVVQPGPLASTLGGQMINDPQFVPEILAHVGPLPLADWVVHFVALLWYRALHATAGPVLSVAADSFPPQERYEIRRWLDAWKYGSGQDYKL